MGYGLLADVIALVHLLFVLFVMFGALFALRWPGAIWVHAPALIWGLIVAIGRLLPGLVGQPIRALCTIYCDVFRGMPAIVGETVCATCKIMIEPETAAQTMPDMSVAALIETPGGRVPPMT